MRRPAGIRTRSAVLASLLTAAIAMPARSDALILRNGATLSGTLIGANANTIKFTDRNAETHRYSLRDAEAIQFGDKANRSDVVPGNYG
jgi:hypothetical protein